MPRKPDERIIQAKELYLKGLKLVEIASQLNLPDEQLGDGKVLINGITNVRIRKANVRIKRKAVSLIIKTQKSMVSSRSIFRKRPFLLSRRLKRRTL